MYNPEYNKSLALLIGINNYKYAPPLEYARHDAEAVAQILVNKFGFLEENMTLLMDESATRDAILNSFLDFTHNSSEDDRIIVFFAGHGFTYTGKHGEVGYLVPVDGMPENLATLIRWDDLTRNSDLIPAKHILFIMDACYGGLAITRTLSPGSMRFLKDMLQRYSRQVLTAGKADEVVADSWGPIPNHSVFTGHFLEAINGKAATPDAIISANGVMSYVYERVAKDLNSRQTPHFGYLEGDGDFIFSAPILQSLSEKPEIDKDIMIEIPPSPAQSSCLTPVDLIKEYISESRHRIKLDDLVTNEIRSLMYSTSVDNFPVQTATVSAEEFSERLKRYESIVTDLQSMIILLSH